MNAISTVRTNYMSGSYTPAASEARQALSGEEDSVSSNLSNAVSSIASMPWKALTAPFFGVCNGLGIKLDDDLVGCKNNGEEIQAMMVWLAGAAPVAAEVISCIDGTPLIAGMGLPQYLVASVMAMGAVGGSFAGAVGAIKGIKQGVNEAAEFGKKVEINAASSKYSSLAPVAGTLATVGACAALVPINLLRGAVSESIKFGEKVVGIEDKGTEPNMLKRVLQAGMLAGAVKGGLLAIGFASGMGLPYVLAAAALGTGAGAGAVAALASSAKAIVNCFKGFSAEV